MKKRLFCACLLMVVFLITGNAHALVAHVEKLASAEPEECYNGLGERVDPTSTDPFTCPNTGDPDHPEYALPYTPQAYVWSLTQHGSSIWFGTGANIICTTQGALFGRVDPDHGEGTSVCEFGESPIIFGNGDPSDDYPEGAILPTLGDWRPAKIYRYDLDSEQLIDKTPYADPKLDACLGFRAGFDHNSVVILAGGTHPTLSFNGNPLGIVMFAFDSLTGEYLGSKYFPDYRTIRKGKVIAGHLYVGVGAKIEGQLGAGRVLRYTGRLPTQEERETLNQFALMNIVLSFEEVGNMPNIDIDERPAHGGVVRDLAEYKDGAGNSYVAVTAKGVWLSPPIPETGGLPPISPVGLPYTSTWDLIWSPEQYEPDYITRQTYVGGGIEFLNGWLYFMTMHIPGSAEAVHVNCAIPPLNNPFPSEYCFGETQSSTESDAVSNATSRATTLWRIKNPESASTPVTQLLYGASELPQYTEGLYDREDPGSNPSDAFPMVSTGYTPLLGAAGFNDDCNNYGWVLQAVGNSLLAGTMDYCTVFDPIGNSEGADLWRIDGTAGDVPLAAVPETTNAFKDFNNPGDPDIYHYSPYGFRNLIQSADGTKLFAGMATAVNVGAAGDGAGWQLLQLDLEADPPPFCSWDIEPVGSPDADVDGLDLDAAAIMALSPAQLGAFAHQFGDPSCQ